MTKLTRRDFSGLVGAAGLVAGASGVALSPSNAAPLSATAEVVIVGGGAGGATLARQLRQRAPKLSVTLIEARETYTSPFFVEHALGGFRSFGSITHRYDGLAASGVTVIHDRATDVDPAKKQVMLSGGTRLGYERLVLAPGVAVQENAITGYGPRAKAALPHGWTNDQQGQSLRIQLLDMPDGGNVVLSVPNAETSAGHAHYTRASVIAHHLKYHKPRARLVLLDANREFAFRDIFEDVWSTTYAGLIDHRLSKKPGGYAVTRVDPNTREVETANGTRLRGDVVSIVPPQRAGDIAVKAGCVAGAWCPIDLATFRSTLQPDIHIIGDAADATGLPRTATIARGAAETVAAAIAEELTGRKRFPVRLRDTQWLLLATNNAAKLGANYRLDKGTYVASAAFRSTNEETAKTRASNFEESLTWYRKTTEQMFAPV
ncbi:MAG: FAD/NAD(P)-binding oxidoreductase [Pseudomonadota bacterium]